MRRRCVYDTGHSRESALNLNFLSLIVAAVIQLGVGMQVEHHDLHYDFPEMRDAIRVLKTSNAHFAKLFDSHHRLIGKAEDLEEHGMPVADFTIEDMKKQRAKLKGGLYPMLLAFSSGQQHHS